MVIKHFYLKLPDVNNIAIWKSEAERYAQYDYDRIWNECVIETINYLKIAKEALNQGILDLRDDTLQKLGYCHLIAIYHFESKHLDL
jgi:hypothetical protein